MKNILILFFIFSVNTNAQKLKGFGSANTYLDRDFIGSAYLNLGLGLEYDIISWLRTEAEISYFVGWQPIKETVDNTTNNIISKKQRLFDAYNFSIAPKFVIDIGTDFERRALFQIMPRINFTKITAKADYFELNKSKTAYDQIDFQKNTENSQSIGIGIGIYAEVSEKKSDAMSFNLYYQNINFGSALSELKDFDSINDTSQVLGAGINYYFGFIKKKKK